MKNKLIKTGILATLAVCLTVTSGCQKDDMRIFKHDPSEQPAPGTARELANGSGAAEIRLGDTWTAGMTAINLDVRRIAVHYTSVEVGLDGWLYFPIRAHVLDVLQYQDGKTAFLGADYHLPAGTIDEARVEFGDNSSAMWIDGNGKHSVRLTMTESEHIASASVNVRVNKTTKLGLVLNINAGQSILVLAGGEIVRFHPHMKLARVTHEGMNGAPAEPTMDDTK